MAGIMLAFEREPATVAFTDPGVAEIDAAQYAAGDGPCLDAFRTGREIHIDDTRLETRWAAFSAAAAAHGVCSTLSLPLTAAGSTLGALTLYARSTGQLADLDRERTVLWTAGASTVVANAAAYADARTLNENLQEALRSRATIDQAIGIILAGGGRTPNEAFDLLVRASQRENRKLRDVAAQMVDAAAHRRSSPPPESS
jgi:GAF domain-containing protein